MDDSPSITNFFHSLKMKLPGKNRKLEDVTEEEIISMVQESHEQGILLESEAKMIHNIFEFGDKEVKDIMTHRSNIIALDGELSFLDATSFMIENHKSRYPVYIDEIDNIIGILHIKDAFSFCLHNELYRTSIKDIPKLIRDVDFVPETMRINDLFTSMRTAKCHMYIVIDEYGQTSGIVALEDILEEIVGNIEDEHDNEISLINELKDGSYLVDGSINLEELAKVLGFSVDNCEFDTLSGLLVSLMDKVPNDGDKCEVSAYGYKFIIINVENMMIRTVKIIKET